MSFSDYRNNDLDKYRSSFVSYTVDDLVGRQEFPKDDNFYDMGVVSGTVELNTSYYKYFKMELGTDVSISGSHSSRPKDTNTFYVELYNPSTHNVSWDSWFVWSSDVEPTLNVSGTYLLVFNETNVVLNNTLSYTKCIGYLG